MTEADWPTCHAEPGCSGRQGRPGGSCLAHADPADQRRILAEMRGSENVDVRGVRFSGELLRKLLAARTASGSRHVQFGYARFNKAEFVDDANFQGSVFTGTAFFAGARFEGIADFAGASFSEVDFTDTFFQRAVFHDASFRSPRGTQLALAAADYLDLSGARVNESLTIQCPQLRWITATNLHCAGNLNLQLDGGIVIDATAIRSAGALTLTHDDAGLTLIGVAFDTPSTIAGPTLVGMPRPSLLALKKVDATNLTLVGLRLDPCRFAECYNRDRLRIEGRLRFKGTPDNGIWTRRNVLADEHLWRAQYDRRPKGWFPDRCRQPADNEPVRARSERATREVRHQAAVVQGVYRDLRKGREDAKDEPGASDFYFGEMEMRRMAAAPVSRERFLLTAYWALSGYGLRASRALVALVLALGLGTLGFATVGFGPSTLLVYEPVTSTQPVTYRQVNAPGPRPGWGAAVDHSVDSATALLRASAPRPLTPLGRVFEIGLRLLGPLLLGLAVLALRNRVKR